MNIQFKNYIEMKKQNRKISCIFTKCKKQSFINTSNIIDWINWNFN
jgi:hypothetical protein